MHVETLEEALAPFREDELIDEVVSIVKSGKEAVVYCCRGGPKVDAELVAAKVYKPKSFRSFRNDALYREGRVILNKRDMRAVAKRTGHGREVSSCGPTTSGRCSASYTLSARMCRGRSRIHRARC